MREGHETVSGISMFAPVCGFAVAKDDEPLPIERASWKMNVNAVTKLVFNYH
ncbi:hypothetical protein [Bifidobacterium avesanii]|uniref:hypothetical protein n=1 Tax=Bifidobacterium avesanii TaxID=1798157 RepID=UPI0013CFD729|nr:hypothetical protein [Bifidobacterium avesanii]